MSGYDSEFVLLLQEVLNHPHSYLTKLVAQFEITSVIQVHREDDVRKLTAKPVFDDKYLVLFDDVRVFQKCAPLLRFQLVFPVVHVETKASLDDAVFFCRQEDIGYRVYRNEFTKEQALEFIVSHSKEQVSDSFCKKLLSFTKLSPMRIITALAVCEQMGYTVSTIDKYVDKWVYPDTRKLIECLLHVPRSKAARNSAISYLHANRSWYRFVKRILLEELDVVLTVYSAKNAGKLVESDLLDFIDTNGITRARVMYALKLFDKVSIVDVVALREFLKTADLMDVVLRASGLI